MTPTVLEIMLGLSLEYQCKAVSFTPAGVTFEQCRDGLSVTHSFEALKQDAEVLEAERAEQ